MTGVETAALIAAGVSAAAAAAGTVMAGQQQKRQSSLQAQAQEFNAAEQRTQAGLQMGAADAEAARQSDANRRRLAGAANAVGATGAQTGTGTPLDLMADLAAEASLDEEIIRWRGTQAGTASLRQARITDWQAGGTRAAGRAAATAANLTAGTNLLASGARIYGGMK
jgi:uncharacterized protein (DUF2147 family)